LFPSFFSTLNPNTEYNPKRFFPLLSWNKIGFFTFFSAFVVACGLVQKTTAKVYQVL
tara:strand:- start:5891 stop:6061 length:171 start_codon:yes stop_codon:yes gene_type:complete